LDAHDKHAAKESKRTIERGIPYEATATMSERPVRRIAGSSHGETHEPGGINALGQAAIPTGRRMTRTVDEFPIQLRNSLN
jgi:hypothetical protein